MRRHTIASVEAVFYIRVAIIIARYAVAIRYIVVPHFTIVAVHGHIIGNSKSCLRSHNQFDS
eukprot:UN20277